MEVIVPHEYEMFAGPSFNIVTAVWMLLKEDKAPKVWPISICVRGIEEDLKPPCVYSKLRVSSGKTYVEYAAKLLFPHLIPSAQSPAFLTKKSQVLKRCNYC